MRSVSRLTDTSINTVSKLLVDAGLGYLPANGISIILCSLINFVLNDRLVFVLSGEQAAE